MENFFREVLYFYYERVGGFSDFFEGMDWEVAKGCYSGRGFVWEDVVARSRRLSYA
jgi:hypothetical protein